MISLTDGSISILDTDAIERSVGVNRNHYYAVLNDYMAVNGHDYPCNVG